MPHLSRTAAGHLIRQAGSKHLVNNCCACHTLYGTSYDCSTSLWTPWAAAGANHCLPTTTSLARTGTTGCNYQQYTRRTGCCATDADCTVAATAPALPVGVADCCGTSCGCLHGIPGFADVTIAGVTSCTACYTNGTESAHVSGACTGTFTLQRIASTCAYQGDFSVGSTFHEHCFSNNCNEADPTVDSYTQIRVRLSRVGVNSWQITVRPFNGTSGPATLFYDSGTFTWSDTDSCAGTASAAIANVWTSCSFATSSASCDLPESCGHGGTGTATLNF